MDMETSPSGIILPETHPSRSSSERASGRAALGKASGLLITTVAVSAINYANTLILARLLVPAEYGAYTTFTAVFMALTLLPVTLQQLEARRVAMHVGEVGLDLRPVVRSSLPLAALILLGAFWLAIPLHLPAWWLIALGLGTPVYALLGALRGAAQGKLRMSALGVNWLLEHGAKIALTALFWQSLGGLNAAVVGVIGGVFIGVLALWPWRGARIAWDRDSGSAGFARDALSVQVAQAVIGQSDIVMARVFLPPTEAGVYALIGMIGRAVGFVSVAVNTAFFPLVARYAPGPQSRIDAEESWPNREDRPAHKLFLPSWTVFSSTNPEPAPGEVRLAWMAIGLVALAGGALSLACALGAGMIPAIFGAHYASGVAWLAPYALTATLYAISSAVTNHQMALGARGAVVLPAIGAAAQVGLLFRFHSSGFQLVIVQMVVMGALALSLLVWTVARARQKGNKHVVRGF